MPNRSPNTDPTQNPLFGYGQGSYELTERPIDYDEDPQAPAEISTPNKKPRMQDFSADEMIDTALLAELPEEVPGVSDARRLQFLRMHPDWVPDSEMEVTASIGVDRFENPPLVTYLLGAKAKNMQAVRQVVGKVTAIRTNATRKIFELEKAYDQNGNFLPSVIREDPFVRMMLAEYIYAVNELNLFDWPDQFISRQKKVVRNKSVERQKVGISEGLLIRTDEDLSSLTVSALSSEHKRAGFWAEQEKLAMSHRDTELLVPAARSHV